MSKALDNTIYDVALDLLVDSITEIHVCSADPVNYAGIAAVMLATKSGLDFSSQAAEDGDTSGRKIALPEVAIASITNSGTAVYIAYTSATVALAITTCTSQVLTATNPLTVPTIDLELRDPA